MLRIIKFLITGDWHLHVWEKEHEFELVRAPEVMSHGASYHCKCKICGKYKLFKLT